ncbi:MAG TPA: AMP-binding protein [Puia sp.]|nr:AMP-binding protein [Puia sp.]
MLENLYSQVPSKIFLQTGRKSYSYQWLQEKIKKISGLFKSLNLSQGDRILLAVSDESEMSALFLTALANGITAVIADPESKAPRAEGIIRRTNPKCLIADKPTLETWKISSPGPMAVLSYQKNGNSSAGILSKFLQKTKLEPLSNDYLSLLDKAIPATEFPDPPLSNGYAYIIFTSGTTADSKGVAITHGNLSAHLATLKKVYNLNPDSALLNQLMLCHADGCIQGPVLSAYTGCTWHHPFRFTIEQIPFLLDYCYANSITHFFVVPAMLNLITQFSENYEGSFLYPEFKAILSVSAHLEASLWDRFESIFKVPICNIYGLTETVAGSLFSGPLQDTFRKYTVGKPVDCSIKIINDEGNEIEKGETGELCLRGDHIMKNYWDDQAATKEAIREGWFHTGDLASQDRDGFITIRGRKKNLVISGGINIQPEEVTECLLKHPAISESCVLGLPDEVFGEKLVAAVVLRPGYSSTTAEIAEYCRQFLEEKKVPSKVHIVSALPKGVSGKVQLNVLKDRLSRELFKPNGVNGNGNGNGKYTEDVLHIAAESFQVPVSRLSIQDTSQTVEGWDSLAHLSFITSLEHHFKIRFDTAEVITMNSIRKAAELIKEKHG